MECYQVLNKYGNPASNDFDDMCVFPTVERAVLYIKYLVEEIGLEESFSIRPVDLTWEE